MIKQQFEVFIAGLNEEDKNTIITFLLESQILEYGIKRALLELPISNKLSEKYVNKKPLGELIKEMDKSQDPYLMDLIETAREFNDLRKEIIHHLVDSKLKPKELIRNLKEKIVLSKMIQFKIERVFKYLYCDIMKLGEEYGRVF